MVRSYQDSMSWSGRLLVAMVAFAVLVALALIFMEPVMRWLRPPPTHYSRWVHLTNEQNVSLRALTVAELRRRPCTKDLCPGRTPQEELAAAFQSGDCNWINGAFVFGESLTPPQDALYEALGCPPDVPDNRTSPTVRH